MSKKPWWKTLDDKETERLEKAPRAHKSSEPQEPAHTQSTMMPATEEEEEEEEEEEGGQLLLDL